MKLFSKFLACALAVGMFSCASDEPLPNGGNDINGVTPEQTGGIHSTIHLSMPKLTRSGIDNEGEEVGQTKENMVGSILLVIAQKDAEGKYQYVTSALKDDINRDLSTSNFSIIFQDKAKLFDLAGQKVAVFAYCNPTPDIRQKIQGTWDATNGKWTGGMGDPANATASKEFMDLQCALDVEKTWTPNGFLMTSIEIVETILPTAAEMENATSAANKIELVTNIKEDGTRGPDAKAIPVIRTMSRFDIKDKAKETNADADPWSYPIYKVAGVSTSDKLATVVLKNVALYNNRQEFYYLPRVTTDGEYKYCPGMTGMELLSTETPNFVVSPDTYNFKLNLPTTPIDPTNRTNGFANCGLEWTALTSLTTDDNNNDWNSGNTFTGDWKIWTYATENTFPWNAEGEDFDRNKMTGVVFEAEIVPEAAFPVKTGESMYAFDGFLYASADQIAERVKEFPNSNLKDAFDQCFEEVPATEEGANPTYIKKDGVNVANYGFTEYKPTNDGKYYCYYFYDNIHVDDKAASKVGPMEYATVRNNIYKLAVSNILRAGTFEPTDPTEWDVYFKVDVELKNWVVRVNDGIEF